MTSNNKGLPQQRALRTREMHRSHTVAFPAFSVAFTPSPTKLLIGGGGGATKAGIKNAVIMAEIQEHDLGLKHLFEHRFEKDDDGCMNIAVHPKEKAFVAAVNSPERTILSGNNRNCRAFRLSKTGMKTGRSIKTTDSLDGFNHQKSARFSPNGKLLCTGTTDGKLSVNSWPALKPAFPAQNFGSEIIDIHFNCLGDTIGVATPDKIRFLSTAKGKSLWELPKPTIGAELFEFRALRFGANLTKGILFVILNAKSRKSALIQKYDVDRKKLLSTTPVSIKPITTFALSPDGSTLAFGSSDLSITVMSAVTLNRVTRVQNAHGFPPTSIDINSDNSIVASVSADGTCMLTGILPRRPSSGVGWGVFIIALVIAIVLLGIGLATMLADTQFGQEL
ncbi:hypothetical protein BASA50_001926 [Batrachochytrium salamandrivorans]|uniref:Anaphase-promoting complex subunit 4 WD40 domain-containing protein n=1 Tax=Batrachochytrium salamandrivorans TaxID=1357716 RepID=A0ABQ8FMV3_9FUNG|nr:hypothetical protein BASA62_006047 [Batrachochytrium salamandrivorans]KAH6588333.1 hypothetical protein BASA61_005976 [Batrachochytrium salamandrivorans]KAH6601031.1 hypothetical protein BASA50_001926 [Batrachochytrium salamandrivorans]KAH9257178.1 hypothetical protein BASA81_004567 [Batrachochytrium salamandrivorans]KAH9272777.1 hypothetical protein BASA83_004981 [Batrachochytrium salamandrivorans]